MRLTNEKRDMISKEVINRKFRDRIDAIMQEAAKLAEEKVKKEIAGIPIKACDEYISYSKDVYFSDAPQGRYWAQLGHLYMSIKLTEQLPMKKIGHWDFRDADVKKILKKYDLVQTERVDAMKKIYSVLASVKTTKQLFEILPEIEPLVNQVLSESVTYDVVPVETIEAVRQLI